VFVYCIISSKYAVSWSQLVDNIGNSRFNILLTGPRVGLVAIKLFFLLGDSEVC